MKPILAIGVGLVCVGVGVSAGLSPLHALRAATSAPARAFGLEDRGRIAPGLRADLLLVDGDPMSDITAARNIVGVWKGGGRLDHQPARAETAPGATRLQPASVRVR